MRVAFQEMHLLPESLPVAPSQNGQCQVNFSAQALSSTAAICGFSQPSVQPCLTLRRKKMQPVCMAHPRRVEMVAKQIRREVGEMLIRDKVLQHAVLPEAALGADMYMSSVTTISDVEVSRDLQVAKIYISVFGDQRGKEIAFEGLKAQEKYVRMQLGRRMKLRLTPEVRFIADDSFEKGSRVIKILDKLKAEREKKERGEDIDEREEDEEDTERADKRSSEAEDDDESEFEGDEKIIFVD